MIVHVVMDGQVGTMVRDGPVSRLKFVCVVDYARVRHHPGQNACHAVRRKRDNIGEGKDIYKCEISEI